MTHAQRRRGSVQAAEASLEGRTAPLEPGGGYFGVRVSETVQWIVLEDFPDPATARALSPNGRTHFGTQIRAKKLVRERVWLALLEHEPWPVQQPASVLYRWIVPDRRKRDLDNHGTGVIKAIQDCLVKWKILPDGDHSDVLTSRVEIVFQKYRRAIEIRLAPATADPAQAAPSEE